MEQTDNTEFLNNSWASNDGQAQEQTQVNVVKEEDYKSLQAEFTRTKQSTIDLAIKLANKDKQSILEIGDKKLQDKVIKEIYWLNNIEEVKLIHWDTFYKERENEEDENEDKFSKLERELKLMKYNQSKSEIEKAIEDYKKENKDFFEQSWNEEKLRDELKYISTEISPEDRVKRAWKIIFGLTTSSSDAAYLKMQWVQKHFVSWNDSVKTKTKEEDLISSWVLASFKKKEEYKNKFR